jgi:hypothetical protein
MIGLWLDGYGWLQWIIPGGAIVSLATMRTRVAPWTAALSLILIVVGLEASRFSGRPHLTEKMDATFFDWAMQLGTRANTGVAVLLSAGPIGAAAAPLAKARPRALPGLLVGAPIGLALLISSLRLHRVVVWLFANIPAGTHVQPRIDMARDAVRDSERVLLAGVALAALGLAAIRVGQLRGRRAA